MEDKVGEMERYVPLDEEALIGSYGIHTQARSPLYLF